MLDYSMESVAIGKKQVNLKVSAAQVKAKQCPHYVGKLT